MVDGKDVTGNQLYYNLFNVLVQFCQTEDSIVLFNGNFHDI